MAVCQALIKRLQYYQANTRQAMDEVQVPKVRVSRRCRLPSATILRWLRPPYGPRLNWGGGLLCVGLTLSATGLAVTVDLRQQGMTLYAESHAPADWLPVTLRLEQVKGYQLAPIAVDSMQEAVVARLTSEGIGGVVVRLDVPAQGARGEATLNLVATAVDADTVAFQTAHVTNHDSPDAMYMGEVIWTFIDADHIKTRWWGFQDGVKGEPMTFDLRRMP